MGKKRKREEVIVVENKRRRKSEEGRMRDRGVESQDGEGVESGVCNDIAPPTSCNCR